MKIQIECIRITSDLSYQPWLDNRQIEEENEENKNVN